MLAIARIIRSLSTRQQILWVAAAIAFAAFVAAKGIPTLRHDWNWPIDRTAIPSFVHESIDGWVSIGLGQPNPHPTTYLIALPIAAAMWLFGPLAALAFLTAIVGYVCMRSIGEVSARWNNTGPAALGIGLFALFNPWVYNEVVAGHLVMLLAYGGLIGLLSEMMRARGASSVRLALWVALIQAQLQFFIVAMLALVAFAFVTRKWMPPALGVIFGMPSVIGLFAERGALLRIPYEVEWQTNQSVAPLALLSLGGYFPGYADRLGIAAAVCVWTILALAIAGAVVARRLRAASWAIGATVVVYVAILGVHGPLAVPYEWIVRNVRESGVFRELYDLAGVFAALIALLACAVTARFRATSYVALAAGIVLPVTWLVRPPSDLWIGSSSYPHPAVSAPPFTRVAFLPAFQPLGLRAGGGDGADPDAYVYPDRVAPLNEYFPSYPVDMALARYEQSGDAQSLRALGVAEIVPRPWLISLTQGRVGMAASSLQPRMPPQAPSPVRYLDDATPLISVCERPRVVRFSDRLGACDLFFDDAAEHAAVVPLVAPSDSIDPRTAWIDARLAFAESPALAQAIGGVLTQSALPQPVEPNSWLLVYVRGALVSGSDGRTLEKSHGAFAWLRIPGGVASVKCAGLCELVAQAPRLPSASLRPAPVRVRAANFRRLASCFYLVDADPKSAPVDSNENNVLRFDERYDPAWIAFSAGHALRHVRIDMSVNGWFLGATSGNIVLIQAVALLQLIAEIFSALCVLWLLKALALAPTKRAP